MEEYCIRASVFEEYCSEYLSEAFRLAEEALASGEVPVGCILVNGQRMMNEEEAVLETVPEKDELRCTSEMHELHHKNILPPSPLVTRRDRRNSLSEKAASGPSHHGHVKYFCRERGHGYITPSGPPNSPDIFVHISDVEGDYVPHEGDEVVYKLCPIPPKFEKQQAVHVVLKSLATGVLHERWDQPIYPHKHPEKI